MTFMKLIGSIVGAAMLAAPALLGEVYKFDFAKESAPLREGFIRISEKNTDHCQWHRDPKVVVLGHYKPVKHEWTTDKARGIGVPPTNFPIDLTAGHVSGKGNADFVLPKVAPGDYRIWVLVGNAGGSSNQVWDTTIKAGEGQGNIIFPGQYEIMEMDFPAKVADGGLRVQVETRSRWLINCMLVVPVKEWKSVCNGLLKDIREDVFYLPKDIQKKWTPTQHKCPNKAPDWSAESRKNGFALFCRPWSEVVWPNDYPLQHELELKLRAFASWGEYEPMTFTIHPFRDFEKLEVTLSDLVGPKDDIIPAGDIDMRYVRYMWVRPNYSSYGFCYRAPDVLMPWKPQPLVKEENLRLWLTIKVPKGLAEGIYKGTVTLNADGTLVKIPLAFRVLPITLLKDESLAYGQYYSHPLWNLPYASDSFSRTWWEHKAEAEHEDMRECGMNTIVLGLSGSYKNGRFVINYDEMQQKIDLYRKYGFTKPIPCSFPVGTIYSMFESTSMGSHLSTIKIPPKEFFDKITQMVAEIKAEIDNRQWPELLFYPVDEPSTSEKSVEFMLQIMKAIKKVPGVRTYITADPAHEQFEVLRPYVDVWCCQPFTFPKARIEKDMAETAGLEYWCYPNHISGENDHTPVRGARMTYGYGFRMSGFRCLIPWIYQYSTGSQWNNLDSRTSDFVNRCDMNGNPIPVTLWVAYREGIDDGRYINTLEKWIARAKRAGYHIEAKSAQDDLDLIFASVKIQQKYKYDNLWTGETMDVYRWLIARQILNLQSLF